MSEWSDEAVAAALAAYYPDTPYPPFFKANMRAALTAADAVRKREAGATDPANVALRVEALERRLTALEAARPGPTIKPDLKVANPRRRCGTCRFRPGTSVNFVACGWAGASDTKLPTGIVWTATPMLPEEGTDCPTWEARNV